MNALAQLLFAATQVRLPSQQACSANRFRQIRQLVAELRGNTGQFWSVRSGSHQHQISQDSGQTLKHRSWIPASVQQIAGGFQQLHRFSAGHGAHEPQQLLFGDGSQQIPDGRSFDGWWQQTQLIQQTFGIPESALGALGHHMHGIHLDFNGFLFGDPAEMGLQGVQGNPAKIEALASAENRRQHPLWVRRGQHKHHLWRWLFQRFQQRVECRGGEHVALIHHIHLPAGLHWCEAGALNQFADVVDTGV